MKNAIISILAFLPILLICISLIPINTQAESSTGNRVTCYSTLSTPAGGTANRSVYQCSDCLRWLCAEYSNQGICTYKGNEHE